MPSDLTICVVLRAGINPAPTRYTVFWLLAAGYWPLVSGYLLLVAGY
jgi:hypothetical protein